jgi:hypothetical protein
MTLENATKVLKFYKIILGIGLLAFVMWVNMTQARTIEQQRTELRSQLQTTTEATLKLGACQAKLNEKK